MNAARPTRVLFLTESAASGGASRYVRELSASLNRTGAAATVLANVVADEPHHKRLDRSRFERLLFLLELAANRTDFRHFASRRAFPAIPDDAFDVIHLNQISGGWLSLGALQQLTRRFPTVWTHHDEWAATEGIACNLDGKLSRADALRHASPLRRLLGFSPYHSTFKSQSLGRLIDRHFPRVDIHITPSFHLRDKLLDHPRHREATVRVIRNATTLLDEPTRQIDRAEARRRLGIADDAEVVLMVSVNLGDVHKGLAQGLEALHRLKANHPRLEVVLLGRSGPGLAASIGGLPHRITEATTAEDLALHYRAADVTLIPSLSDNFPYVAIESLACETPFAAFAMGGPLEIADNERNGLLAECFRVDRLADCTHRLLTDESLRRQLGTTGAAWVLRNCDPDTMLDAVEQTYDDAITAFHGRRKDRSGTNHGS
jgi:glycosyltransferase involved in cell wall biosynthesis